jgi:CheY-like chemotaxis protein
LGLSAVLGIVKGHKGDVEIESRPGIGTMFRILLPVSKTPLPPRQKGVALTASHASGQTVLVVDDEQIVLRTASLTLERRGYRVLQAVNGSEAIQVLRAHPEIALVILDLTMPVMTGEQTIPLIKNLRPAIPILLSSGFSEAEVVQRFASSGIAGFLQKPYDVSTITAKVTNILRNNGKTTAH